MRKSEKTILGGGIIPTREYYVHEKRRNKINIIAAMRNMERVISSPLIVGQGSEQVVA